MTSRMPDAAAPAYMPHQAAGSAQRLHSRYNPAAEAERYIDSLCLDAGLDCFILIEPGLGCLAPPLQKRFPGCTILALHADSGFRNMPGAGGGVPSWYPDSAESVQDFLERHVPETARTRVIEWRPALRLYGERCLSLIAETARFLKRAEAGRRTAAVFGRKWVRNFFRNAALINTALLFKPFDIPVVVAGSGPGLESALPLLARMREQAFIIAASSSLLALAARGIPCDMAISTDGGFWALAHLFSCFRKPRQGLSASEAAHTAHDVSPNAPVLAAALCAALPSQCASMPVLALSDGSLWQSIVLDALKFPALAFPQRGTVSAAAVDTALALSGGPVYLAGLDLSVQDIREHARPYAFDHLFYGSASRLKPAYSHCFARSGEIRRGGSHEVYAAWFKKQLATWPQRIFALEGNSEVFKKTAPDFFLRTDSGNVKKNTALDHFRRTAVTGTPAQRRNAAVRALTDALDSSRFAGTLIRELSPLLFPAEREVSAGAIRSEICRIAEKRGEESGG